MSNLFKDNVSASNSPVSSNQLSAAIWMDVGFGDTAASADDIKLADGNMDIVSASGSSPYNHPLEGKKYLTIVGISNNSKVTNEIKNVTVVYRNDTQNTVTIKEVGMYINPINIGSSYWGNYNQNYILLAMRKVLTTPIAMAPGDVYALTYRVSLNI